MYATGLGIYRHPGVQCVTGFGLYFHMSRSALDSVVSCTRLFSADGATVPPFFRFFPSCSPSLFGLLEAGLTPQVF